MRRLRFPARCRKPKPTNFRFFKEHAGGVVGERARGAFQLAQAECVASARGYESVWDHDSDPDLSWASKSERESIREVLCVRMNDKNGETIAGPLCGIVDPSSADARVYEAEMALEAVKYDSRGGLGRARRVRKRRHR